MKFNGGYLYTFAATEITPSPPRRISSMAMQFGFNVGSGHFTESFDMKSCNTSFNVGAGVKLLGHLQAGVNYNFGLSKMARSVDDQMTIEMKRNTWQISLAYMF